MVSHHSRLTNRTYSTVTRRSSKRKRKRDNITMRFLLTFVAMTMTSCLMGGVTSEEYVVETVVLVDKIGQEKWERETGKVAKDDLETELQSVFYEVNEIYKSLSEGGINVRFQIKEMEFLKSNFLPSSVKSHEIESMYAAMQFREYLSLYNPKVFDIAVLYTGNSLLLGDFIKAKGFSRVGQLCTKESVGLVKLTGTFDDVLTTAHELAHVFNAKHDDGSACASEGYIMTNWKQFLTAKRYQFSECSKRSISNILKTFGDDNCLLKTDKIDVLTAPRYGTLMTADAMCKRSFNSLSYASRQNYSTSGYGDNVCLKLACRENTWRRGKKEWRTSYIPSPDGLYCGKNKQCLQGKCIVSDTGKDSVSDSCPFGDQPVIEGDFPKGCGQISSEDCPKFKDVCCETCNQNNPEFSKTADDECRKLEGSKSQLLRLSYDAKSYGDKLCSQLACLKEPDHMNGKWNTGKHTAPDGMACGKNKRCSGGKCVQSADGNPAIDDGCPFGDQPFVTGSHNKSCDDIVWRTGCVNGWEKVCCGSCRGKL